MDYFLFNFSGVQFHYTMSLFFIHLIFANIRPVYKDFWIFYGKEGKQVRRNSILQQCKSKKHVRRTTLIDKKASKSSER